MDNKRMILAMVLAGLVLVGYMALTSYLNPPPPETPKTASGDGSTPPSPVIPVDNGTSAARPTSPSSSPSPSPSPVAAAPAGPALYRAAVPEGVAVKDDYRIQNDHLTSRWTNESTGACLEVKLNHFHESAKPGEPLALIGGFDSVVVGDREPRAAAMVLEFPELAGASDNMTMRVLRASDNEIVFVGRIQRRDAAGAYRDCLEITKTVSAAKDAYELEMTVSVQNLADNAAAIAYDLRAFDGITVESNQSLSPADAGAYSGNASARVVTVSEKGNASLKTKGISGLEKGWKQGEGNVRGAGMDDRYFVALAWAEAGGEYLKMESASFEPLMAWPASARAARESYRQLSNKDKLTAVAPQPVPTARVKITNRLKPLAPQAANVRTFHLLVAPKRSDVLDCYSAMVLPNLVDYGMWGLGVLIATPILWLLRGIHYVVCNYGIAILFMTAVIRLALHPLTKKGQVAMAKMQRLRPKIQELQKRFKNDRQKLAEEQMRLFREAGVSPMSGCLPMLLQMPILFALFYMLRVTFELRQAPFVGWISDLSLPDSVGHFPAAIPFIGGVAVNILPLLMTAAMLVQQIMQPKAEDEQTRQQQKIMMFLPVVFIFFMYSLPSGLCLYWFASTVIAIGEQWYIQRHIVETLGPSSKAA